MLEESKSASCMFCHSFTHSLSDDEDEDEDDFTASTLRILHMVLRMQLPVNHIYDMTSFAGSGGILNSGIDVYDEKQCL